MTELTALYLYDLFYTVFVLSSITLASSGVVWFATYEDGDTPKWAKAVFIISLTVIIFCPKAGFLKKAFIEPYETTQAEAKK